jgi:hypothetical protein
MEKEAAHGVKARNVGTLSTLDIFTPTIGMEKDRNRLLFVHFDRLEPS